MVLSHYLGEGKIKVIEDENFVVVPKHEFRNYFQPSRVVIGVIPAPIESGYNLITLSYNMWCSKTPIYMVIAIHKINATYDLVEQMDEYVLSVPGPKLVEETMHCGIKSMRDTDKIIEFGVKLTKSKGVRVPGLANAIANIELTKEQVIITGDHALVIGEVKNFTFNSSNYDYPLLSIGSNTNGYRVLAQRGIHRLAIVNR